MKKFLQAVDSSSEKKPVEGSKDMSRFLSIVLESEQVPAMPDVSGIQPGQSKDLGDGSKVTVNKDGTVSYSGAWGTYIYNAQGQHIKTQSPSFAGYSQEVDPQGAVTKQNYNAGPMSLQKDASGTSANYDLGVAQVGVKTDAKGNPIQQTVKENDVSKFLSIIDKNDAEKLMEGRGPLNRLTQAESIAMNTYSEYKPTEAPVTKPSLIDKYFKEVEVEFAESLEKKQEKVKQLAERAIEKVTEIGGNYGHPSNLRKHISQAQRPPEDIIRMAKSGAKTDKHTRRYHKEETEGVDSVTLDVPLMIRLLEFAREDAQDDMTLHQIVERMIGMKEEGQALSMSDYDAIVGKVEEAHPNSKIYDKCWTGYKKVPGKKRGEPGSCEKK